MSEVIPFPRPSEGAQQDRMAAAALTQVTDLPCAERQQLRLHALVHLIADARPDQTLANEILSIAVDYFEDCTSPAHTAQALQIMLDSVSAPSGPEAA